MNIKKLAEGYLALRSQIIRDVRTEGYVIYDFAEFVTKQRKNIMTRKIIWDYLSSLKGNCPRTKYQKLRVLRTFCRYLHQIDERHHVPEMGLLKKPRINFKPHIFTEKEVIAMMKYAREKLYQGPPRLIVPFVYETLIGLLWTTGMRTIEAVNLNLGDIDLERGLIYIRKTKFYKSRIVPVLPSTVEALKEYLQNRSTFKYPTGQKAALFFNWRMRGDKRGRYTTDAFYRQIYEVILALKIKGATRKWARPYDLRHSFGTHQLSLVHSDKEAIKRMPLVAVYMGHKKVTYTQTYLHPSVNTLAGFGKPFLEYFENSEAS